MRKEEIAQALRELRKLNSQLNAIRKSGNYVDSTELLERLTQNWMEIKERMDRLTTLEAAIILDHYVNLNSIQQMCLTFFYSERQIKRIISRALDKMADDTK